MSKDNIRLFLFIGLLLTGLSLYNHWQRTPTASLQAQATATQGHLPSLPDDTMSDSSDASRLSQDSAQELPEIPVKSLSAEKTEMTTTAIEQKKLVSIETDVLSLKIDLVGGDIVYLGLPAYGEKKDGLSTDHILLDESSQRFYIAQSGLIGKLGPDVHGAARATYTTEVSAYRLAPGQETLTVDLNITLPSQIQIIKRLSFKRGSYAITVSYSVDNRSAHPYQAHLYARLKRRQEETPGSRWTNVQTFTGAAVNTPETPYKKIPFKDVAENDWTKTIRGGWSALVEQYFLASWIPAPNESYIYRVKKLPGDNLFGVEWVTEKPISVAAGELKTVEATLYAGPQIPESLEKLAPKLDLTVDYGILWPICKPIFWLLKKMFHLTCNWGWAIILTTLLIKALFYHLSAASYRSMGNMRKMQPQLEALKARFGADKQKMGVAMMELYKKEKINPLGGCLPILVQIPVFIALYYVLLGSIELRHAPFIGWIQDLSAKDPYYVLPILMGITMVIQQKLSPASPDPVQAKMMMIMPIVFTALFFKFPAGLVLYWIVNNLLSILQQWLILRRINQPALPPHVRRIA